MEDTVEYEMKNTYFFRPELSEGLTGQEVITIPHPLILVSLEFLNKEKIPIV